MRSELARRATLRTMREEEKIAEAEYFLSRLQETQEPPSTSNTTSARFLRLPVRYFSMPSPRRRPSPAGRLGTTPISRAARSSAFSKTGGTWTST